MSQRPGMDRIIAALIFALSAGVFSMSDVRQVADSRLTLLMSESLLKGKQDITSWLKLPLDPARYGQLRENGYPLLTVSEGDRVYYSCPHGSSWLSTPFVALLHTINVGVLDDKGQYDYSREGSAQRIIAAILMAGLASVCYLTARLLLRPAVAAGLAMVTALGTPVWSTASRGLWAHTWFILLLSILVLLLLGMEVKRSKAHPFIIGTLAAWLFFVRPTALLPIALISAYLLYRNRRTFFLSMLTGILWMLAFVADSWLLFHSLLPPYYRFQQQFTNDTDYFANLYGLLFSPSRGLFICIPVIFFLLWMMIRYRRYVSYPLLMALSTIAVVGQVMSLAALNFWVGGACFGPRYLTDILPWIVLLAILCLDARTRYTASKPGKNTAANILELGGATVLIAASIFINARGAMSLETWHWTAQLTPDLKAQIARVMDWRYPQWLAGLIAPPMPTDPPRLEIGLPVELGNPASDPYFPEGIGWSGPEGAFRRTDGKRAFIAFSTQSTSAQYLEVRLLPFVVVGKLPLQRVEIILNDSTIASLKLTEWRIDLLRIGLPKNLLRIRNMIIINLPDARSPYSLGTSPDTREFGVCVYSISLSE